MGKLRSAIYSHYSEDPERGLFSCLYCGTHVSISSGTSNMHKHLRVHHPEIDRYVDNGTIVFDQNEFGVVEDDGSHVTLEMPVEELPSTSIVVTSPQAKRKRISGVSTTSTVVVLPSTSTSHVVENEHELNDIPGQKILKRLKQITTDHAELTNQMYVNNAELQNEVMQLQFENQEQMRLIKELRREVNDLKRRMTAQESSESTDYLPKLPIYRMEQVDTLEQRIAGDPEFKERLAAIFREGHSDKVEAIMKWISKEILSQFTYKNDPDSLTTHRCADLSEMFQLMFSVWSSDTFTQEDFKAVVKNAIESANCELSAENCESNKNRQEVEVEEYESEVDDKRGVA